MRLVHHWIFEEVLSERSRCGEGLGNAEPYAEMGVGGG